MVTLELHEVEIDHCLACGGIWFDTSELSLLLGSTNHAMSLINSFGVVNPIGQLTPSPCPICDRRMAKINIGPEEKIIVIDRCQRHHGLWFRQENFDLVLTKAALDEEHKIRNLLRTIFLISPPLL